MARKRNAGLAFAVIGPVSKLPWWVGVAAAFASYAVCHYFANRGVDPGLNTRQMALQAMVKGTAGVLQYVVPLLCAMGAAASIWRSRDRQGLLKQAQSPQAADAIDGMTWQEFERLVGAGFQQKGFEVTETGGGGADGGVDLVLRKGGEKFLVQCKQWRAMKVGVEVVRELYGVMAARGAAGGFVVTSGQFTADAQDFAKGRNIKLMDGVRLQAFLRQAQSADTAARGDRANPAQGPAPKLVSQPAPEAALTTPDCPLCGKTMVRRQAKRGANAGAAFWGCTGYPDCRGTRKV